MHLHCSSHHTQFTSEEGAGVSRVFMTVPEKLSPHKENSAGRLTTFAEYFLTMEYSLPCIRSASKEALGRVRGGDKEMEENRENKPPLVIILALCGWPEENIRPVCVCACVHVCVCVCVWKLLCC